MSVCCDPWWLAPSVLAMIWDWLLLNTFKTQALIVLDVDINFFISALGFKTGFVAFVFVFPPLPPTSVSQIQLEGEGNFLGPDGN